MKREYSKTANKVRSAIIRKGFIPITSYEMGHAKHGICKHEILTKGGSLASTLITCGGEYIKTIGAVGIHFGPRGGVKTFATI